MNTRTPILGCRDCGIEPEQHGKRYHHRVGLHDWQSPTVDQMQARQGITLPDGPWDIPDGKLIAWGPNVDQPAEPVLNRAGAASSRPCAAPGQAVSREQQRRRIEQALQTLPWPHRSQLGLDIGGQHARSTLAGLLLDAFAPELTRGRDATEALARVTAAVKGRRLDDTIPVRQILDALYGEKQR